MKPKAEVLSYESLVASYEEGGLQISDFILKLEEHGWFDRYVTDVIGMLDPDLPFADAYNAA